MHATDQLNHASRAKTVNVPDKIVCKTETRHKKEHNKTDFTLSWHSCDLHAGKALVGKVQALDIWKDDETHENKVFKDIGKGVPDKRSNIGD